MKLITIILGFFLLPLAANAADSVMVYQLKGKISQRRNGQIIPLKAGNKVSVDQLVSVGENSSVTFICSSYQSFTLTKKNSYLISTQLDKCADKAETALSKEYFSYVWTQFTHPHHAPETQRREYMKSAGGVSRGCPGLDMSAVPDTIYYTGSSFRLQWKSSLKTELGFFLMHDAEGTDMAGIVKPKGNTINLDSLQIFLTKEGTYYWSVLRVLNDFCDVKTLIYVSKATEDSVIKSLKSQVIKSNPAEEAFMLAFMLEKSRYYQAAILYYKMAVNKAPRVKKYLDALNTQLLVFPAA